MFEDSARRYCRDRRSPGGRRLRSRSLCLRSSRASSRAFSDCSSCRAAGVRRRSSSWSSAPTVLLVRFTMLTAVSSSWRQISGALRCATRRPLRSLATLAGQYSCIGKLFLPAVSMSLARHRTDARCTISRQGRHGLQRRVPHCGSSAHSSVYRRHRLYGDGLALSAAAAVAPIPARSPSSKLFCSRIALISRGFCRDARQPGRRHRRGSVSPPAARWRTRFPWLSGAAAGSDLPLPLLMSGTSPAASAISDRVATEDVD